jgi:hypothetical protein
MREKRQRIDARRAKLLVGGEQVNNTSNVNGANIAHAYFAAGKVLGDQ